MTLTRLGFCENGTVRNGFGAERRHGRAPGRSILNTIIPVLLFCLFRSCSGLPGPGPESDSGPFRALASGPLPVRLPVVSGPCVFRSSASVLFCCLVYLSASLAASFPLFLFFWPLTARISPGGCRPQALVACGACVCPCDVFNFLCALPRRSLPQSVQAGQTSRARLYLERARNPARAPWGTQCMRFPLFQHGGRCTGG
jgi:hypothetical protein